MYHFHPDFLLSSREDEKSHFDACVVIDVLRATSTIVTALSNGASEVLPVLNLGRCYRIRQERLFDWWRARRD